MSELFAMKPLGLFLFTAFFFSYLIRLWWSMETYWNDWWAVECTLKEFKNLSYMWVMRGVKKYIAQDYVGAMMDFNEAYIHKPHDLKALFNLSVTYLILGDINKSKEFFAKAKENIYDELENDVKPAFDNLESIINEADETVKKGEPGFKIDLSKLMVVK